MFGVCQYIVPGSCDHFDYSKAKTCQRIKQNSNSHSNQLPKDKLKTKFYLIQYSMYPLVNIIPCCDVT